ncbi:trigger factor [Cardinium endosymbiont of Culicoides punctatus]|uniref:trigger factor n=1 Tax=Cardinium endosymbiont of Culicoides punctatus TaxID=2304601 RepID=UPI001058E817|nr:trigger factor [Cardinium endosymbiont of Culicoides punctatus]TDG95664.1 Trigger factor [Cardinium endosymbiont of Culicoides punctatus]
MDIQFNKINPGHGVISITLHEPDYKSVVDQQIKHHAKNVRLKGFRLGTAPIDLVKKMYAPALLAEELPKLAMKILGDYITQESISIAMEPIFVPSPTTQDISNSSEHTFAFEIGLLDDFPIELGLHISVTKFEIGSAGDKSVGEFLEVLQMVHGVSVNLEESAEDAILHGTLKDISIGNDADKESDLDIRISVAHIPEHLRERFIGLRADQTLELPKEALINHSPAFLGISVDEHKDLRCHKTASLGLFTVSKINHVTSAPLTPQLFDLVLGQGVVDSEDPFRERVRNIILFDKRAEARYLFYNNLRDELFKHVSFELPDSFVKKWISVHNSEATIDQIDEIYKNNYLALKWEILLSEIVKRNNLIVTHSDILDEAKKTYLRTAQRLGDFDNQPSESAFEEIVTSFLKQGDGKFYRKLHVDLSRSRAINFIEKHISVMHKEVTVEQFDTR